MQPKSNCKSAKDKTRWSLVLQLFSFYQSVLYLFIFQLSINGDKEFLDNAHKVNTYHLSPVIAVPIKQSEEGQEAGPLPVKVDLNKTCV